MASGSIAPKAGVERDLAADAIADASTDAEAIASVGTEERLGASAMNVIEEPTGSAAADPGAPLPSPAVRAEGPVQSLAAAVREDAAQAEAARAEAEVARLLRETRERSRKILAGAALAAVLLLGLLVWTRRPSASADTETPPATERASDATGSNEGATHPRGSSAQEATEPPTATLGDAAAEPREGRAVDVMEVEASAEPAGDVPAEAEEPRATPRSRPRSPARKNDPDAPWIRR